MFSAKKKKRVLLLFDKKYSCASSSSFLFWEKKSLQQNVWEEKRKCPAPLPKRVDTSQKDAQKITHPDDDDDDDGVRGVL